MKKSTFLKAAMCCFLLSFLNNFSMGQTPVGIELIPNGSFENGATPTTTSEHYIAHWGNTFTPYSPGIVNFWTAGYTDQKSFLSAAPSDYGGLSFLFDYTAGSYGGCNYNAPPNNISNTTINIQPQHGQRFVELLGFSDLCSPQPCEGSSVMTEFQNTTTLCNGIYTLSFWAKHADYETNGHALCGPNSFTWGPYGADTNNKIEVVLRIAGDLTSEEVIYVTSSIIPTTSFTVSSPWVNYTTTFTLTPSQAATFNRIEFRVNDDGGILGAERRNLIDNISLKYNGPIENVYQTFSQDVPCGDPVNLDGYNLLDPCSEPTWYDENGDEVLVTTVTPTTSTFYRGVCYEANGCYKGEVQVYINIIPKYSFSDIYVTLCGNDFQTVNSPCPSAGATNRYLDLSGNGTYTPPGNPTDPFTFDVYPNQRDFTMVTEYANGCNCEVSVHVDEVLPTHYYQTITLECGETIDLSNYVTCTGSFTVTDMNTNTVLTSSIVSPSNTSLYFIQSNDPEFCCEMSIDFIINPQSTPNYITIDFCKNELVLMAPPDLCSQDNAVSWNWEKIDSYGNPFYITNSPTFGTTTPGQYISTTYYANGCECTTIITLNEQPSSITEIDIEIPCGENVDLSQYDDLCGYPLLWSDGSQTLLNPNVTPKEPVTYIGNDTDPNTCCKVIVNISISGVVTGSQVINLCNNESEYVINVECIGARYEIYESGYLLDESYDLSQGYTVILPFGRTLCIKTFDEEGCLICDYCYIFGCTQEKRTITSITKNGELMYGVEVYPNPSTGVFTLELTGYNLANTTYTIVDAVGREVMKVENIDSEKSAIDMSRFEKGIYFIRVNQNGAIETKKIIIQ